MNIKLFLGLSMVSVLGLIGCKTGKLEFISPKTGFRALYGDVIQISVNFPSPNIDSVIYSLDGTLIEKREDTAGFTLDTKKYKLGDQSLTAKVYAAGKSDITYSTISVLPDVAKNYGFEVVNTYPHATDAFTQGLQYADGVLYETTGKPDGVATTTSLRKVDLTTGKVLKKEEPTEDFFGEGMTIVGDKIVFLTWTNSKGFFYDKNTFKLLGSFAYGNSKEGWGLTYDGARLIKSDGTNKLYFLNVETGAELGFVSVYDENGAVDSINELEYIDGKVYANVWGKDIIIIINPINGAVEGRINLVGIYKDANASSDKVLNGIAYDIATKHLFVTGKLWSKLFEIKVIER